MVVPCCTNPPSSKTCLVFSPPWFPCHCPPPLDEHWFADVSPLFAVGHPENLRPRTVLSLAESVVGMPRTVDGRWFGSESLAVRLSQLVEPTAIGAFWRKGSCFCLVVGVADS